MGLEKFESVAKSEKRLLAVVDRSFTLSTLWTHSRILRAMNRTIEILFLALSVIAFLSAIWIVIPAPATIIWLFAVAASEWSLWLAMLALTGITGNIFIMIWGQGGKLSAASIILGTVAIIISLYPVASTVEVARENGVDLSFSRYFASVGNVFAAKEIPKAETYKFANIGDEEMSLDVYLPATASENSGASVVVVHGGSWNGGVRSDFPQWNWRLAEAGFTVFDIDYRLAPQPNYLTATGDVKCAIGWIGKNAERFNIDSDRIALLGRSAGAHLALLTAYSSGDDRLPSSCSEINLAVKIRAVVSLYAPIDLLWAYDNPANSRVIDGPQTLSNFLGGSPHDSNDLRERYVLASPTSHVNRGTPPTLIIHGGKDQLVRRENLQFLDQKLSAFNISHKTLLFPYAQHGFDYNINGWGSQVTERVMLEFLSNQLK